MNIRHIIMTVAVISGIGQSVAAAQSTKESAEKTSITAYRPVDSQKQLQSKTFPITDAKKWTPPIESLKKEFKALPFFRHLVSYAVLREGNFSLCDKNNASKECGVQANELLIVRKIAEGRCADGMTGLAKEVCQNIDSCQQLPAGYKQDICLGYTKGDLELLKKAQTSQEFCAQTGGGRQDSCDWDEADARAEIAIFQGFKYYGAKKACEKFSEGLHGYRAFACEILFNTDPTEQILDSITTDLARFWGAIKYKAPSECEGISRPWLKAKCLSGKINNLDDI